MTGPPGIPTSAEEADLRAATNLLKGAREIIRWRVWNPNIPEATHGDREAYDWLMAADEFLGIEDHAQAAPK